jgi:hypothetical protein
VAVADDLNLVGSPEGVFRAFTKFGKSLHNSGLVVRKEKCGVLWPSLSVPPPESVRTPASQLGLTLHCGVMQTLGVLVGSGDPLIDEWLTSQVASHQPFLDALVHPELPAQVALLLLRLSAVPLLGYLTRTIRPSLLAPHARRFDMMVMDTAQRKFALPPLPLDAALALSRPIKAGGFGLTQAAVVSVTSAPSLRRLLLLRT